METTDSQQTAAALEAELPRFRRYDDDVAESVEARKRVGLSEQRVARKLTDAEKTKWLLAQNGKLDEVNEVREHAGLDPL